MVQMGGAVMAKWVIVVFVRYAQQTLVFRGVPFPIIG